MADVQANITLTTTGGDQAAAEINKASVAIGNITTSSTAMQEQFQHRFQHIGLMLFAGDALRASGLGRETRMVVSALNAALMGAQAAAGIASGGIMLLVVAFAALAGIAAKVISHHKDEAEALAKLAESQGKALDGYEKEIGFLEQIRDSGGQFTASMERLLAADRAVAEDMRANLMATQEKEIDALKRQRDGVQHTADLHALFAKSIFLVQTAIQTLLPQFQFLSNLIRDTVTWWKNALTPMSQHIALTGQAKQKFDELTASIRRVELQHDQMSRGASRDLEALAKSADAAAKKEQEAYKKMWAMRIADARAYTKAQEKELLKQAELAVKATSDISKAFATAFAKNIVEGQNFSETLQSQFKAMAERFIEYTIEMMVIWAALKALMEIWGGPGIAAFKTAATAAYPGLAQMGLDTVAHQATGGSMMADRPTMVVFGDAGPEVATFTPVGSSGGSTGTGGGNTVNIGPIITNVSGAENADDIARTIGQKIIQQIRGQGQLDFVRG